MKHNFRILIGMLLFAIPLCMNAQVNPKKSNQNPDKAKMEQEEKKKAEMEQREKEKAEKKEHKGGPELPKLSGFVQGLYQVDLDNEGKMSSNTLRMRRVRLSVDGTLAKGLTYKIQGDFSRSPMLVDAYLKYKVCDEFAIHLGQFKTPFSIESPINPVNLEIFDYGEAIKGLVGYDDVCGVGGLGRDIGIMATGDLFPIKGKDFSVVNYAVGVFNGNGPVNFKKNEKGLDNNNRKDIVGRLEIHPGLKNLTLSGSYYYGKYTKDDNINCTRKRWAAGAQYNDGNLVVRGEYLSGTTGFMDHILGQDGQVTDIIEIHTKSEGYYALAGYNFKLGKEKSQQLMPVLRYEHFTKDVSLAKSGTTFYTVGLSYWPIKYVNVKLNYQLIKTHNLIGDDTYQKAFTNRVVAAVNFKF